MAILIGTDEAGYGPNLGPLVISATAWRVPDEAIDRDLYTSLSRCVCETPGDGDPRVAIADSKMLYRPGFGLADLERGVLALLRVRGVVVRRWQEVWATLDSECDDGFAAIPWHDGYDTDIPCNIEPACVNDAATSGLP